MTRWTENEIIIAYALYCITPLNKINPSNPVIKQVAQGFNHSVSSLVMRMRNFVALDPNSKKNGLTNVAKTDRIIFNQFKNDWGALSVKAEQLTGLALFDADPVNGAKPLSSLTDKNKVSRERHFFRASVFAAYDNTCCISGLDLSSLLVASHIKPYSKCRTATERTDPTNGLLLNALYDKAFDSGILTILPNYTIRISPAVNPYNSFARVCLCDLEQMKINLPDRFKPKREFLEYHNDVIFKR